MKTKFKFLILTLGLITAIAFGAPIDKFDTITTNSPSKLKVDFLKGIKFLSTDSLKLPVGSTAQRDATPADGMLRLNSSTSNYEAYVSGGWNKFLLFDTLLSVPVQMDMNTHKIVNVTDPTSAQDAATKNYVDVAVGAVDLSNVVDRTTNQSVGGNKTFTGTTTASNPIVGSVTGNAATVTTNANLTGEVTSVGNSTTVTNAAVIGKVLTGYSSSPGTVSSTDTIVAAIGKLNGNIAGAGGNLTGPITATAGVSSITSQTGTGTKFVVDNSPTLITPDIGVATATSINGTTIPASKTLVDTTNKLSALAATTSSELAGVISDETGTNKLVYSDSPTLVTPNLGTPSALVGTNITGTAAGLTAGNVTSIPNLTGEVVSTGTVTTVPTATVIGKTLTGYTAGAGTVSSSDTILTAIQKVDGNSSGASVIAKPITGYVSGAGTVTATDSILTAINKLNGNTAALTSSTTASLALKQDLSTILLKGDLYVGSASGATGRVGTGSNGQVLQTDTTAGNFLSYRTLKEDNSLIASFNGYEDITTWIKGNAATPVPGTATGTFIGTLAKDSSTALNGLVGYKYTQASSSLNDYFCSPAFNVPPKLQGITGYLQFPLKYDGANADLQVSVWDTTSTATQLNIGNVPSIPAQINGQVNIYSVGFNAGTTQAKVCYQVKNVNNGKVFSYADVAVTLDGYQNANVNATTVPVPYTATFTGFGTVNTQNLRWWREGVNLRIAGTYVLGTPTSTEQRISFPSGLVSSSSINTLENAGSADFSATLGGSVFKIDTLREPNVSYMTFGASTSTGAGLSKTAAGDSFPASGQTVSLDFTTPIQGWDAGSSAVVSNLQQVSSDTMTFAFKSTAIVDSDPVGTYNTYKKPGTSRFGSTVLITTAPTQTASSINANGFMLTPTNYNTAGSDGTPSRVDIKIGKGLKAVEFFGYDNTGKPAGGELMTTMFPYAASEWHGMIHVYNENTGILTLETGNDTSTVTTRGFLRKLGGTSSTVGYIVFNAATTPTIATIKDASVCAGTECLDVLSAEVSATGVVSNLSATGWLTGNCVVSATAQFDCPILSTLVTQKLNCTTGRADNGFNDRYPSYDYVNSSTSSLRFRTTDGTTGTASAGPFVVSCQKAGADSKPKTFKIASSIGVPTVPGIVGVSTGQRIQKVGGFISAAGSITAQVGNGLSSSAYVSGGKYTVNFTTPFANTNYLCTPTMRQSSISNRCLTVNPISTSQVEIFQAGCSSGAGTNDTNMQVECYGEF